MQSGNRYYYSIDKQALVVQMKPYPIAWRKTPGAAWKRAHGHIMKLDTLSLGILELDPVAEFDRSSTKVYRLVPSAGRFEYEPDWDDSLPFPEWNEHNNWRKIVSNLMNEIDPAVLARLRQFSHLHFGLLEAIHDWPDFSDLLDANPALAVSLAGRIRVGARGGERRSRLDYASLVRCGEKEIAGALGFGDSEEVVNILRKLVPDACKPFELTSFLGLLRNSVVRKAFSEAEIISYPALTLLRNPYLASHLAGSFLSDMSSVFPHWLDIVTCPWGPLFRGGSKADQFTSTYQKALDVVQVWPNTVIHSMEDLDTKYGRLCWIYGLQL
jgi:hypothetical protein